MVSLVSSLSLSKGVCHVRSISLPSKSHASTLQVEEELTHLKSREASSLASTAIVETISGSLMWLKKLYTSVNDLISLPQTQQALSHRKDDRLVDELLDRSMRLLDVCGSIKDAMEQVKDQMKNIEYALRRGKEVLKSDVSPLLKIKDAKRAILALKQIDNKIGFIALSDLDHHLSSLMSSLRDTSAMSFSIFGSLMSSKTIFVWKPKSTIWTMVSSLINKRKPISEDEPQISNEALELHIKDIEGSLECMSRTLIKTRVSLLNIRSS